LARTTADLVKAVLAPGKDYNLRLAPDLAGVIDEAALTVDALAECAVGRGKALSDARLEMVERLLAAHNYKMSDQALASKNTDGASATFQGQTGMNLEATKYGQRAMLQDVSGCLRTLNAGKAASGEWLGKTEAEQLDAWQRGV
jgi:hypothetical protein